MMATTWLPVYIVALVLLLCCWVWGKESHRTKLLLTVLYAGSWLLALVHTYAVVIAQVCLSVVFWLAAFGTRADGEKREGN
jgi:hypothetical protein